MAPTAREKQLRDVRIEVAERCYHWALKDAAREITEDCRLLRKVRDQAAYSFLEMIEPLPQKKRLELITALLKRFHMGGPASAANVMTAADQRLVTQYLEYDHGEILPGLRAKLPIVRDGRSKHLATDGKFRIAKIDRVALHRAIAGKLRPVCGEKLVELGPGSSFLERQVGHWVVSTQFSTASRFRHFDYWHRILLPYGIIAGEGIAILRWFGISGMSTWTLRGESEVDGAVADLGAICAHFLQAVPDILKGFDPSGFELQRAQIDE